MLLPVIGVIGGSGFIGSALVRAVHQAGHAVRIIDRAPSQAYPDAWIEADVRDREALRHACRGCGVLGEADETAATRPFNECGRTKLEAEQVFRAWTERAAGRSLTIIRPTVVFGPDNRGNVYTLLEQIARGRAVVVGDGRNRKSMAYVENVAGVLVHALTLGPGVHVFNYADKPDLDMNALTTLARAALGDHRARTLRIPYVLGIGAGPVADLAARLTGRRFPVSAIRVRKYRANTQFANARVIATWFVPRHDLRDALIATIRHEFGSPESGSSPHRASAPRGRPAEEGFTSGE